MSDTFQWRSQALSSLSYRKRFGKINRNDKTHFICLQEQTMLEQFGDEYEAYVQQTKRLIPYFF